MTDEEIRNLAQPQHQSRWFTIQTNGFSGRFLGKSPMRACIAAYLKWKPTQVAFLTCSREDSLRGKRKRGTAHYIFSGTIIQCFHLGYVEQRRSHVLTVIPSSSAASRSHQSDREQEKESSL